MANEISYITGLNPDNTLVTDPAASYWTSTGATARKWGSSTIGTTGGNVTYCFAPTSGFAADEQATVTECFALWAAVANIKFTLTTDATAANVLIQRGEKDSGDYFSSEEHVTAGSGSTDGVFTGQTLINYDTLASGFDLSGSFSKEGGYGLGASVHEMGHMLGLGHGGPYNSSADPATQQYSAYDSRLWSTMSYIVPQNASAKYFDQYPVKTATWGDADDGSGPIVKPTTMMPLDILAVQQIYGAPVGGPLSGGNVFGFNTNIDKSISNFFDFALNTHPVVTLYDSGPNNTLDLSGYTTASTVDLNPGTFSSVNGAINDIAIAFKTVIDHAIGGSANDTFTGNGLADVLQGNAGSDTFTGGTGNDVFKDTGAHHNGDTVTDFHRGDVIWVTDAAVNSFTFNYDPTLGALTFTYISALTFDGGPPTSTYTMTLPTALTGAFGKTADAGGGVDLGLYNTPALTGIATTAASTERVPALLNAGASVSDQSLDLQNGGLGNYAGSTITLGRDGGASPQDLFGFGASTPGFTASGGVLATAAGAFGTYGLSGGLLTLAFTSAAAVATTALVDAVLAGVTYANGSDTPPASVLVDYTYTGTAGAAFKAAAQTLVNITPVDTAPVLAGDDAIAVKQGGTVAITVADLKASDADNDPSQITYTVTGTGHGSVLLNTSGSVAPTTTFTEAQLEAGLVSFRQDGTRDPAASFTITVSDGTLTAGPVTVAASVDLAPIVSAIVPSTAGPTNATALTQTVTFSEAVSNVSADDFVVTTVSGAAVAGVASVAPVGTDGTTYLVTLTPETGDGVLRLDLKAGTDIVDATGTPAAGFAGGGGTAFDHTPPAAPVFTSPAAGAALANNNPVVAGTGETGDSVALVLTPAGGGAPVTGSTTVANGVFTFTPASPLPDGTYAVSATQTDAAGNVSTSATGGFTVDTTAPAVASANLTVAPGAGATPIGIAAPTDNTAAAANLSIVATALPTDGTVTLADGTTAVTAGMSLSVGQLTGLTFTPTAGASSQSSSFAYTVADPAGNATAGSAALAIGPAPSPPPVATISVDPDVSYDGDGAFTLTGHAASSVGISSVDVSAVIDGARQDLGDATLNPDGSFAFTDPVGASQSFIFLTLNDAAGGAVGVDAPFELTTGVEDKPYVAVQDRLDPASLNFTGQRLFAEDGSVVYDSTYRDNGDGTVDYTYAGGDYFDNRPFFAFTEHYDDGGTLLSYTTDRNNGSHATAALVPGQALRSNVNDTLNANGKAYTSFVFTPGFGQDTVLGFKPIGPGHDQIVLPSSAFANLLDVLHNTSNAPGGAVITDPTSGDTIRIAGVSKATLFANRRGDFALG